jgi:hypothetical protein
MYLRREYHNYSFSEITSSPFIRALYDTVWSNENQGSPSCLVFEWMDHDLESVTAPKFRGSPLISKVVAKAVLSALTVFKTLNAVHKGSDLRSILIPSTEYLDVSLNNIFVSHVDGSSPVAKLGDLGNSKCCSLPHVCTKL